MAARAASLLHLHGLQAHPVVWLAHTSCHFGITLVVRPSTPQLLDPARHGNTVGHTVEKYRSLLQTYPVLNSIESNNGDSGPPALVSFCCGVGLKGGWCREVAAASHAVILAVARHVLVKLSPAPTAVRMCLCGQGRL